MIKNTNRKNSQMAEKLKYLEIETCNVAKAFIKDRDQVNFNEVLRKSSFDGYHIAAVQDLKNTPVGRIFMATVKDETGIDFVIHLWRNEDLTTNP